MSNNELMNLISFAVTIGLGVISIFLGIFAIWLSRQNEKRSNDALDKIKELASEIRNLTRSVLIEHQDFSSKMLDSILSSGNYGSKSLDIKNEVEELSTQVRETLVLTENRILDSLEKKIKTLIPSTSQSEKQLTDTLVAIKDEIANLRERAVDTVTQSIVLPKELKSVLKNYVEFPEFFPLIAAIEIEDVNSIEQLGKFSKNYNFRVSWDNAGIIKLIEDGILDGTPDKFKIKNVFKTPLKTWISRNKSVIEELVNTYSRDQRLRPDRRDPIFFNIVSKLEL